MPRIISSSTPINYNFGAPVDAPSIGRRITHATNPSTTSLSTFSSLKPQSLSIPRIRILLAPYMSPFVVPMHKVETWDLLHKALQNLFGLDIFNSSIRITDHQGNSILPSVWQDLLEQDMTIIVDTCSLQAENSPVIFETPKLRAFSPPMSPTYTIRESEDSCYDNASTFVAPSRGVIGQAVPMTPPAPMTTAGMFNVHNRKPSMGRLKNWAQRSEEEKRNTSVSMFAGTSSKHQNTQMSKPSQKEKEKEKEQSVSKNVGNNEQEHSAGVPDNKQKSKHFKSTISRFARALLCVLSAGTIQPPSKDGNKDSEKQKRGEPEKPRRTITMEAIENNPGKSQSYARIHKPEHQMTSISRRRGIPSLPPVVPPTIPSVRVHHGDNKRTNMIPSELAFINAEPRRSKSLSHLKLPSAAPAKPPVPTPSPAGSFRRRPRSKSFASTRSNNKLSVISPPIPPRRPSLELGTNAQYKSLTMDKAAIQEIFNDIDGATLSGNRSRSGTGDTSSTTVSLSPTLVTIDKPLPRLPFKFSAFPAPSPPRSPLVMAGWQKGVLRPVTPYAEEEYGRPATAVTRKITKVTLRKVASTDFGGTKRRGTAGGLF